MYYLQSRYYNPTLGRFLNADAFASTGQGILGCNVFTYCLNSPVNGCDPCGTCFHRWDFWNDCEKCGGKTWNEKLYGFATDVYDARMMQNEWQQQIDQTSFNAMRDSAVMVCDAIVEGIENQNKAQYEQDRITQKAVTVLAENPGMTFNLAVNAVAVGASVVGLFGALGVITISQTANIVISGVGLGCSLWGDGTAIAEFWNAICE